MSSSIGRRDDDEDVCIFTNEMSMRSKQQQQSQRAEKNIIARICIIVYMSVLCVLLVTSIILMASLFVIVHRVLSVLLRKQDGEDEELLPERSVAKVRRHIKRFYISTVLQQQQQA
jgi:hypothetical protein